MRGINEGLVFNTLYLDFNLQSKTVHIRGFSEMYLRMYFRIARHFGLALFPGDKLQRAKEACWQVCESDALQSSVAT